MFWGIVLGIAVFLLSRSIVISILAFYFITAVAKTIAWSTLKRMSDSFPYLPPLLRNNSALLCGLIWPIFLRYGDPASEYLRNKKKN